MIRTAFTLTFAGALAVLVIMNADKFKIAAGAVSGPFLTWEKTLTGSGY